ncbi:MAG TPA: DUF1592 domain-containing protein [Polyangiaceae bacterium]|nr:DUF1592 domain-containing protein [Polyangiaceae bacterium]
MAHTALRRLTRFEYAQTVKDLLKVDPTPSDDIPADEVTSGYDNNSSVLTISSLHAEKYVLVSETLAKAAVQNLAAIDGCNTAMGEEACAKQFAQKFGRRAYRRPLSDAEIQNLMTAYTAGRTDGSYAEGIEVMIRAALQSPDFLFRLETTAPTNAAATLVPLSQFELATRLSYLIWATGPDDALLDAAQAGSLASKDAIAQKAREMLADPKAKLAIANFFGQWSGTNRLSITTKNTTLFPSFTAAMQTAMEAEVPAFLDYVFSGDHSFKTLLTAPVAFVSGPLGQLYVPGSPMVGATPTKMDLPATQGRAGILTMAGFMSVQGHPDQTSPVLRGKFVRAMMLCDPPPPPPDDVNITLPTIDQGATARERFSKHEDAGASCKGCHTMMDPIGLAFENFDAVGSFRTMDNGQPIDVSGEVTDSDDPALQGAFTGVAEMAQKLAASQTVSDCMATQWFRFASGRLELEQDSCSLGNIRRSFATSNGDLVELVVAMTQSDDFWYRAPLTP